MYLIYFSITAGSKRLDKRTLKHLSGFFFLGVTHRTLRQMWCTRVQSQGSNWIYRSQVLDMPKNSILSTSLQPCSNLDNSSTKNFTLKASRLVKFLSLEHNVLSGWAPEAMRQVMDMMDVLQLGSLPGHIEWCCRETDTDTTLTRKTSYLTLWSPPILNGFGLWTETSKQKLSWS